MKNQESLSFYTKFSAFAVVGGMVLFLYLGSNYYMLESAPHPSMFFDFEKNIPFIAEFIIPYNSYHFIMFLVFMAMQNELDIKVFSARLLMTALISATIFVLFPLQYAFVKPDAGMYQPLFNLLGTLDKPFNQMPSMHISITIIYWYALKEYLADKLFLKAFVFVWFMMIGASTLLVYQHHFIDIPTAMLLAFIVIKVCSVERVKEFSIYAQAYRSDKLGK